MYVYDETVQIYKHFLFCYVFIGVRLCIRLRLLKRFNKRLMIGNKYDKTTFLPKWIPSWNFFFLSFSIALQLTGNYVSMIHLNLYFKFLRSQQWCRRMIWVTTYLWVLLHWNSQMIIDVNKLLLRVSNTV